MQNSKDIYTYLHLKRVFRKEGKFPERPGFETLKAYRAKRVEQFASAGLLPGNGEEWWNIRSKAQQPFLKTKNINNYVNVLGQIANEFIDRYLYSFVEIGLSFSTALSVFIHVGHLNTTESG